MNPTRMSVRIKARILSLMARTELQGLWRGAYKVAIGGLGHMNADPRLNGEDRELSRFAQELRSKMVQRPVILDIGANEGDFAAGLLTLLPHAHIHCFEPHPETSARLRARFADDPRVTVNAVGVGAEAGALMLHDYEGTSGTAHASFLDTTFSEVWHADENATEVPIITVDSYLSVAGLDHVDLVKIDVEGFERQVLFGMANSIKSHVIDRVQFEFNAHNALTGFTLRETGALLPGFDVFKLLSNGRVQVLGPDHPYSATIEIFQYSNYTAIRRHTAP